VMPEGAERAVNVNIGESRARGVEWSLRVSPSPRWGAGLDGAWVVTEVLENEGLPPELFPEGRELPFRPALTARAFVEVTPAEAVTARLTGRWVDDQTVLTERFGGRRVEVGSYFVLGLATNVRVREGMTVFARAENLLDRRYDTAFDRPGMPASARIGVEIGF